MNRAALMQRIEQHFGAKAVTRSADLAVLLEDICCQVYQWGLDDALADAVAMQGIEAQRQYPKTGRTN